MASPVPRSSNERARRLSALLAMLWDRQFLPRPNLSGLLARAAALDEKQAEGESAPWRAALEQLVLSLDEEAHLNEVGRTFAWAQLAGLLKQRERAQALWRRHPEIRDIRIDRPVVVLGHMRSGTTRLQRLFGCDPRLSHTRFYEVMAPLPSWPDLRVPRSWAQLALLDWLDPGLQVIHPTSATAVEEVFGLLSFSFYGAQLEAQWQVPGFARRWEEQDRTWVYREFRQLLQTLAWRRGGPTRPWVLKAPQFMEDLDALLTVFPDARLVCLDREPAGVVGSSASLVWNQMKLQSDDVDPRWVGAEWLRKTARRERICSSVRRARSEVPQLEIAFEAMNRDWRSEMRRAYAFLGLEFTAPVERRMARYLREAEHSGFRRHGYRLEDFGLSAETVRARMAG